MSLRWHKCECFSLMYISIYFTWSHKLNDGMLISNSYITGLYESYAR